VSDFSWRNSLDLSTLAHDEASHTSTQLVFHSTQALLKAHLLTFCDCPRQSDLSSRSLNLKWLIDTSLQRGRKVVDGGCCCIAGVYVCQLSCYAAGGILTSRLFRDWFTRLSQASWNKSNRLSADFHETVPLGEKLYRIEQDADQVLNSAQQSFLQSSRRLSPLFLF